MTTKILINAVDPEECRIAKVNGSRLEEFHIESSARAITRGNVYKAIITRVEPSLQAVFVDYGEERNGFLQRHEIHADYFPDDAAMEQPIKSTIKRGQELLVQITKDPFMKKGAMLTTHISLPGRFVVLMPGSMNRGISRKIADEKERARLKDIAGKLKIPEGFGLIIRTAGVNCTKTLINKDVKYLLRLWKSIKDDVMNVTSPVLLYKERALVERSIRDYFTPDTSEILVDDTSVYNEVKNFINIISPNHLKIVKQHKGDKPIFTKFQLEEQIASIFKSRVKLNAGGSIVVEQTEALVSIDVNSGKATQKKSVEQTALQTNLEAAEEIARQLQLRDLGGLIVIDFIDMRDSKHKVEVERALKAHVKNDKAKTKVGRISRFGLVEMSRQRIRPSIEFSSYESCRYCRGKGLTPSPEVLGIGILRKLSLEVLKKQVTDLKVFAPVDAADYILNKKRKELSDLEERSGIRIDIKPDHEMIPGDNRIVHENAPKT
ncbi:Rne/Rng family ribonuclease [Desulfococcaceae bacterium HSG9]|nr:Rne/Rng family ribonuclease [Desulfococcaceae bacterium HSG9]